MVRRRKKGAEYSFRTPGFFGKLAPKAAVKELRKLEKKHGRLTAEIVLDSARKPSSPLHEVFEWDDAVAAEKYRLHQARSLILNIRAVHQDDEEEQVVRVYVRSVDEDGSHYVEVDGVTDVDESQLIMDNAIRELTAWVRRYGELADRLPGVFDAVAAVVEEVKDD